MDRLVQDETAAPIAHKMFQDQMRVRYGNADNMRNQSFVKVIDLPFYPIWTKSNVICNSALQCTLVSVSAYKPREQFEGYRANSYDSEDDVDDDSIDFKSLMRPNHRPGATGTPNSGFGNSCGGSARK